MKNVLNPSIPTSDPGTLQHHGPISGIAAFGGRHVVTAGYDGNVILHDAVGRKPLARGRHDHLANQCAFSPCGKHVYTASSDGTGRRWSVDSMALTAVYLGHQDDLEMIAPHPVLPLVATAGYDHCIGIFNTDGQLARMLRGHRRTVLSVEWTGRGMELLSSGNDCSLLRWDAATGKILGEVDCAGVETDTVISTREGFLFAGDDHGDIINLSDSRLPREHAHAAGIKRLVYSPRQRMLVSTSYDRTARLWQVSPAGALAPLAVIDLPPAVWPRSCAFLADNALVFGTFGTTYAKYDIATAAWDLSGVAPAPGLNAVCQFGAVTLSVGDGARVYRDGRPFKTLDGPCNFLTPFNDRSVLAGGQCGAVYDALSGEILHRHRSPLNCGVAFRMGDRPAALVGSYTGEGLLFVAGADGRPQFTRAIPMHPNAIKGVAESDGTVLSLCANGELAFHAADDFRRIGQASAAHDDIANACAPLGGGRFATVGRDRTLRVWEAPGRCTTRMDAPHSHSIKSVAASRCGRYIATGAYNGRIAVLDAAVGRWVDISRPTVAGISCIAAQERGFLAASYDGRLYPISCSSPEAAQP